MKRKLVPPFLMLSAGAITSIIMLVLHYETKTMLIILLSVLFGFYIVGCLLKFMLDSFDKQNEEKKMADGGEEISEAELTVGEGQINP